MFGCAGDTRCLVVLGTQDVWLCWGHKMFGCAGDTRCLVVLVTQDVWLCW